MIRKFLKKITCVLAGAALAVTGIPFCAHAQESSKLIALTFDDGPNTTTTNQVLDLLEEYHAKASFFLIGDNITEESAVSVKRAYDMGMEIDNHSKTHSNMSKMTPEEIQAEIAFVDEKVQAITGETTKFFRPPFIDTSDTMYDAIDLPFICGIDCQDYMPNVTAEERAEYILNGAKDGVIVLLHDAAGNDNTVDALKIALPELVSQGYEFVTLTELFAHQGETPVRHMLYSNVAKYPCTGYTVRKELTSDSSDKIPLDTALLESLGENWAVEVQYSSAAYAPVIALQSWTSSPPIWQAVQPFYANGSKAVFLAADVLAAMKELDTSYSALDGLTISAYGGTVTLSEGKILSKPEASGDVTGDGVFSLEDIILFQKYLKKQAVLPVPEAADVTEDGILNIFDFLRMKQKFLQK